ncbi:MAG: hypothetical protein ABJO67_12405 [Pseudoruegeria sp.]
MAWPAASSQKNTALRLVALSLAITACAPTANLSNAPNSSETINRMANLFLQSCVANRDSFAATKKVFDQYEFSADAGFGNIVNYVDTENFILASLGEVEVTTKSGNETLAPIRETFCSVGSPNVSSAQAKQALDQIAAQTLSATLTVTSSRTSRQDGLEHILMPAPSDPEVGTLILAVTVEEIPFADFFLEDAIDPQSNVPTFTTFNLALLQSQ